MARPKSSISEAALRLLVQSGYTLAEIAATHRVHPSTVTRAARRFGIPASVHKDAALRRECVRTALASSGFQIPTAELARQLDIPPSTARRHRRSVEIAAMQAVRSDAPAAPRKASPHPMPSFARSIARLLP